MKKTKKILSIFIGSALAVLAVDAKQASATTSLAYATSETAIGGWDYAYQGDNPFGNAGGGDNEADTGKLDGTFTGSSRNLWDGSAPGEIGAAPTGDSPGGVVGLTESGVDYLRFQDPWDPGGFSGTASDNWDDPNNSEIQLVHPTEQDVAGSADIPILSNGLTLTFRARISSTGTLDDIYEQGGAGTSAWPTGGRGPKISGDAASAMVNISQAGVNQIAFTLLTTANVLEDAPNPGSLTGGMYMNNQPGTPGGVGTEDLNNNPGFANFVPMSDTDVLDWHEFWITIDQEFGGDFVQHRVKVYMDGSSTPAGSFLVNAGSITSTSPTKSAISIGTGGLTAYGAADIDFLAYNLDGAFAPVAIPEPATMALMILGGLAIVGLRRR